MERDESTAGRGSLSTLAGECESRTVQSALGDHAAAADLATFTNKKDPHAPAPDLARLQGKRLVAVSEPGPGDPITTRSHYQESFEYLPQFTIWIVTNERPKVPHDDSGIWRRLREIPFSSEFAKVDTSIRPTLTDPKIAGPAILTWIVEGCLKWQNDGLGEVPQQVSGATSAYKAEMDGLAEFIEDNISVPNGVEFESWVTFKDISARYLGWTKEFNIKPLGSKNFAIAFNKKFGQSKKGKTVKGYKGIVLL